MKTLLLLLTFYLPTQATKADDKKPVEFHTKADITSVVETKITDINKEKSIDGKVKILSDLKFLIESENDKIGSKAADLSDEIDSMTDDLNSTDDNTAGENKVNKNLLSEQIKKKQSELDNDKDLIFQWNLYESKLEPLFDLFVEHKSVKGIGEQDETSCDTIENELQEKYGSSKSNQSYSEIIQMAHEMCELSR